jgi:hypothetical protein
VNTRNGRALAVLLLIQSSLLAPICLPDTIALKNGTSIEGRITRREGEVVSITTESGIRLMRVTDLAAPDPNGSSRDITATANTSEVHGGRSSALRVRHQVARGLWWLGLIIAGGSALVFILIAVYESPLLALAIVFVPGIGALLFACKHWELARKPVGAWMIGVLLFAAGNVLGR